MKRIIFSIWQDTDWRDQKPTLEERHKGYAKFCGADYQCVELNGYEYADLQFEKLRQADKFLDNYDEVLYLDMDVIPKDKMSFFEAHDLNTFCVHWTLNPRWKIDAKNAALGYEGKNKIANTGVFGLNKSLKGLLTQDHNFDNNEVFVSYIIEKYNIPCTELTAAWNFILDNFISTYSDAHYFLHVSNKVWNYE